MTDERRKHRRFPIADGLIEPITVEFAPEDGAAAMKVPAILTNLSAGGMSLITFAEPPRTKEVQLNIDLPSLKGCRITAKPVRIVSKGDVYTIGLSFVKISGKDRGHINKMANDFNDCETRISLGLPEACVPSCDCSELCTKPQKAPHWPPRA
jgi:hypothetical protein